MKIMIFFIIAGLLAGCGGDKAAENKQKPNVIYILADDLGYGDLSCFGQEHFKTPHIDRLAKEGMKFTHHYSGSTVCAPSRSVLMTGLHTGHTPIRGNTEVQPEGQAPLPDSSYTIAEMMKDAGYVTGAYGKWGLGFPGSEGDPNFQGFDEFYGYNCQRYAHRYYPTHLWHNQEKIELENDGVKKVEYAPDLIQEQTLAFIDRNRDKPFFLFIPAIIPHAELVVPDDSLRERFDDRYPPGKPYKGRDYGENFRIAGYASQEEPREVFAAMVVRLDLYVGQVMQKIREYGLEENTLVIFTSDNGPHVEGGADPDFFDSNGPLRGYKRDLYEGGIRVPTIAWWPGTIEPGSVSDHISAFWDVKPTLAEIAGMELERPIDGVSFLPALKGERQPAHDYLYWEFHERNGRKAVRRGKWKGVKYGTQVNPDTALQLFNLEEDIGETEDVADQHPDVVRELNGILKKAHTPQ